MAEKHPDELELLAYVEEELRADERQEVVEHLVACRACAATVHRIEAGRDALRASPLLEFPEGRRREALAALPEREPWRPFRPLRRALLVAAPVAAAAAFVGVFVFAATQVGGGDDDSGAAGEAAQVAEEAGGGAEEGGGATEEGGAGTELERTQGGDSSAQPLFDQGELVRSVAGPPAEVVRILRREGIPAQVVEGAVVADSRAGEVEAALAGRPAGPVEVYVEG